MNPYDVTREAIDSQEAGLGAEEKDCGTQPHWPITRQHF